jgi:indolepyruvate ferredoxin oxidoreductase beta subunit
VDVLVASELLEAVRMVQSGHVSPDRTLLIASTSRVYTVDEKSAMGDGRLDPGRMQVVACKFAREAVLADFAAMAERARSSLNAVLLGALAASNALPIPADDFRAAIRTDGKAVEANLRGFEAGLLLAHGGEGETAQTSTPALSAAPAAELEARARSLVPPVALTVTLEGVRRLVDYQDVAYAALYLDRLARFVALPQTDGTLIRELARHLAVRMSYEDTIRVAQLKLRDRRIERLRSEAGAVPADIVHVTEFLKPGPEEIFSLLPPAAGRRVLRLVERMGWSGKSIAMRVRTTRFGGFLRLKLLAGLRSRRPRTLRNVEEQAWIDLWLSLVERTLPVSPAAAIEVVETARLVKGYGATYKRGHANWERIAVEIVEPFLAGELPSGRFADAVLQCRLAALADPEGARLASVIASVHAIAGERRAAE